MQNLNAEFMDHLWDLADLATSGVFFRRAALFFLPTCLLFFLGSGVFFSLFFLGACVSCRSARLGGLVGFFIVAVTLLLFYSFPAPDHFIVNLLRAPARGNTAVISQARVMASIPATFQGKLFQSILFSLRGGLIPGLGFGMLGRYLMGYPRDMR